MKLASLMEKLALSQTVCCRAAALSIVFDPILNGGKNAKFILSQQNHFGNFLLPQVLSNIP